MKLMTTVLIAAVLFAQFAWTAEDTGIEADSAQADTLPHFSPADSTTLDSVKVMIDAGDYTAAEAGARELLTRVETKHGAESLETAEVLDQLVNALWRQGKVRDNQAEAFGQRALAIKERLLGPESQELVKSLSNLAIVCQTLGKNVEAESFFKRALAINEVDLGPDHPAVGKAAGNLAVFYTQTNRFSEAEPLLLRSLAILENTFGTVHVTVARTLSSLGATYIWTGRHAEAEPLLRRALAIYEETLGPDHPSLATALELLANLRKALGRLEERGPLIRRALAIREKVFGADASWTARSLYDLALFHWDLGEYVEAESLLKRTLSVRERALGSEHRKVAYTMSGLADLYVLMNRQSEAESLYERALAIWEKALGPKHPMVGEGLLDLASLCSRQGRFAEAESLFTGGLAIEHQSRARGLEYYSLHHRRQKEGAKALSLAARALRIRQEHFVNKALVLTEKDAISFSGSLRESVDAYLSCLVELGVSNPEKVMEATDVVLSAKGRVSDGIFERQRALVKETDSTSLALAESLRSTKHRLSRLFVEGPDEDVSGYRHEVDSLTRLANDQEANLARHSASFRTQQDHKNISSDRVASLLPENAVLIEYIKYDYSHLNPDTTIPHYLVMFLDRDANPVIMELGEAQPIDQLLEQYRRHLLTVSSSGRKPSIVDAEEYARISDALYEKIWKPFAEHLSDKETVLIAPDGGLNMLSFAGLPGESGEYLIEKFAIHYLSAGRDLIRLKNEPTSEEGLLALGDPDYDADVIARLSEPQTPEDTTTEPVYYATTRNVRSGCGALKELTVDPLPGTRTEVEQIARSWQESSTELITTYLGSDASEERFKARAPGSRVIHLATHGYFLEGACQPKIPRSRLGSDIGYAGENPLLLSGLFLAGANLHGEGSEREGAEDGILTAYEVSEMVLDGTELVVLSACETGLGEVKDGEGVYGLRRAFQMAGARTVISALWPVSDARTAEMMGSLFGRQSESLVNALRRVQLESIADLRSQGKPDHPFMWGAFIAMGDWR